MHIMNMTEPLHLPQTLFPNPVCTACPHLSPSRQVHSLLEDSACLCAAGKMADGLEKAQEAKKKEKSLTKFLEANGLTEQIDINLTYAVDFNLAHMYHMNKVNNLAHVTTAAGSRASGALI